MDLVFSFARHEVCLQLEMHLEIISVSVPFCIFYVNIFPLTSALSKLKEYVEIQRRVFWKP